MAAPADELEQVADLVADRQVAVLQRIVAAGGGLRAAGSKGRFSCRQIQPHFID